MMTVERNEQPWVKSYDEGVAQQLPIPEATYVDLLKESFALNPERTALHYMGAKMTFRELDDLSLKFAGFLKEKGLGTGDVVGINLPNIPEYPVALTGALRAGCAVTGISPLLTAKEMEYQINDSGATAIVIMDTLFEERLYKIRKKVPGLRHIVVANVGTYLPAFKRILGNLLKKIPKGKIMPIAGKEVLSFITVIDSQKPLSSCVRISPEDTCLIQYTGGTTGMPKGTVLTHANMVANHTHAREWVKFEMGEDVLCSGFPYFHLAGLAFGMLAMATANTQCLIPDPRNTKHICKEIGSHKATIIAMVPTLYQMLLDDPTFMKIDFSPLKICISGAAPFSVDAINTMETVVGKGKVLEVYGMTEASPLLTMNPFFGKKKIGSVGIPIQNTIIKLVDLETGETEVGFNEEGEIIASGPQIMKEYHNKPVETEHAIREFKGEKYFFTGDIGKMDEDGYISIVDRAKDMLIVGGYKVFSREVEETLYQHPDVEFCAIVGVPDEKRPGNEIVKAVIQLAPNAKNKDKTQLREDIIAFCRANKAPYKVPKIVEVIDEIPLTAVGKVDKKALR
jgi:long-chain acyl-CoA synthetase